MEKKIKNFCKVTKAKKVDVCRDDNGVVDFKLVKGERKSSMCARVNCSDFE